MLQTQINDGSVSDELRNPSGLSGFMIELEKSIWSTTANLSRSSDDVRATVIKLGIGLTAAIFVPSEAIRLTSRVSFNSKSIVVGAIGSNVVGWKY